MDQSLEREIRRLYSCFHSPADRRGRSFVPLADAYRRAGDLLRARLLLEEGLRRHPGFASAHVVAMRIALDVSDHAGALAATRRVLELDPDNAEARRALADVGPLVEDDRRSGVSVPRDDGDAELPDESWMVGDAGVWGAGTDSGLASVDPAALEDGEEQAARRAEERTTAEAGEARGAAEAGDGREGRPTGVREDEEAPGSVSRVSAAPAAGRPPGTPGGGADAGIYTRTMGRLYERQGLHAQAIAVYRRVLESEPGDDELAGRLERLRRRGRAEASQPAAGAELPGGVEAEERPAAPRPPGDDLPIVPIEALAPDVPATGAREAP